GGVARRPEKESEPDDVPRADRERKGDDRQQSARAPGRRFPGRSRGQGAVVGGRSLHAGPRGGRVENCGGGVYVTADEMIGNHLSGGRIGLILASEPTAVLKQSHHAFKIDASQILKDAPNAVVEMPFSGTDRDLRRNR